MQRRELCDVLKGHKSQFIFWLIANLGGIIVYLLAALTIYLLHKHFGNMLPSKNVLLVTGTISLMVSGVSYLRTREQYRGSRINSYFVILWPILAGFVYGLLIGMGSTKPIISNEGIYYISIILLILCISWSSIIWLHEQGLVGEMQKTPQQPEKTEGLDEVAAELAKTQDGGSK